jgi:hypothetical protein
MPRFANPQGAQRLPHRTERQRSECGNFAKCGIMLNARSAFTPETMRRFFAKRILDCPVVQTAQRLD